MARATPMPPDERRLAIVQAVAPIFLTHGQDVTSKQIAEAAGIAEGTVFRVFKDKRELIHAVIKHVLDPDPICAEISNLTAASLAEVVTGIMTPLMARMQNAMSLFAALRVAVAAEGETTHHPKDRPHAAHGEIYQQLLTAIDEALAPFAGQLSIPSAKAAAYLLGLAISSSRTLALSQQPLAIEEMCFILLHGIQKGTP